MSVNPALVVCMGVSGAGKSTIAISVSENCDLFFLEADDFHSSANKQRMSSGDALTDSDREPWMKSICKELSKSQQQGSNCILAHSALRRAHREQLRDLGFRTLFVHLYADHDLIARRVGQRNDHFMSAKLLSSQFESLEETEDENDVIRVNVGDDKVEVETLVSRLVNEFVNRNNQ